MCLTSKDTGFLPSLIIPGFHELSGGGKRGYVYAAGEAIFISVYGVQTYQRRSTFNFSRTFAFDNAGVVLPSTYTEDWRIVESALSYEDYIEELYRRARQIYPDDPTKQDEYVNKNRPGYYWRWDDTQSFLKFQNLLRRYREITSRRTLLLGLIVLNHLASGVDYLVSKELKKAGLENVNFKTFASPDQFSILLNYQF